MRPKPHSRSLNSFTLVELLVVMGIIAILAAVGAPVYSHAIKAAHFAASTSNLHQIGAAVTTYASDNNNQVPTWYNYSSGQYWWQALAPYTVAGSTGAGSSTVYHDPGDTNFNGATVGTLAPTISYGYNYQVMGRSDTETAGGYPAQVMTNLNGANTLVAAIGPATGCWGYIDNYLNMPDSGRYAGKTPAVFADGHVESIACTNFISQTPYFIQN